MYGYERFLVVKKYNKQINIAPKSCHFKTCIFTMLLCDYCI